jgi:hypothetical protein
MEVTDKLYTEWAWRTKSGIPDINNSDDKAILDQLVLELTEADELSDKDLQKNLISIISNTTDVDTLKRIMKYAKNIGYGDGMKTYLESKNLSRKDILYFQSLLSDLGKTGEFAKIASNPPTFDKGGSNYFKQIPGFTSDELKSLYGDMKDSIQGTVSLGPGEAFLSVFFKNIEKAQSKGDLKIDGEEVELKSRTSNTGALVAPSYVVRGKSTELIKDLVKVSNKFSLDGDAAQELTNYLTTKGTSWPYKIDGLYKAIIQAGFNRSSAKDRITKTVSSWYRNKLKLDVSSFFTDNEFKSGEFVISLAKQLARDYFNEHKFDGFMISDNLGNFKFYNGGSFVDAIGSDLKAGNPSDLVPRIKV